MTMRTAMMLATILGLSAVPTAGAAIRDRSHGIQLHVRPRRGGDTVTIRWRVTRGTATRGATEYAFQYWFEDEWYSFLYTKQRTDHGIPVVARLPIPGSFCFRMVALAPGGGDDEDESEGTIVGSGTSGNEGPCS